MFEMPITNTSEIIKVTVEAHRSPVQEAELYSGFDLSMTFGELKWTYTGFMDYRFGSVPLSAPYAKCIEAGLGCARQFKNRIEAFNNIKVEVVDKRISDCQLQIDRLQAEIDKIKESKT